MTVSDIPMALSLFPGLHATFYGAAVLLHADHRELQLPEASTISTYTAWWLSGLGFSAGSAVFGVLIFGLFGPTVYLLGLGLMYVVVPRFASQTLAMGPDGGLPITAILKTCALIMGLSIVLALSAALIFGSPLS